MSTNRIAKNIDPERERQGATLKAFREIRGLTVNEFSQALGISYAYLSNIEAGRKRLTPQLLAKASSVLSVRQVALVHPDSFGDTAA